MALNGIDVSGYQPENITKLVSYDFVYIKATEGTGYVSASCNAQYQAAKAAGHLVGVYHFADGYDVNAEAAHFVQAIQGYIGEAALVLDMEANALKLGSSYAKAFLDYVKAHTGVTPVIYGSRGNICLPSYTGVAASYPLWVAAYPDNVPGGYVPNSTPGNVSPWAGAICYQYESQGRLSGYQGNLDLDVFYGTAEDWHKLAAKGGSAPKATPVAATAPVGRNITSRPTAEIQKLVGVTADDIYGPATTAAVMKWQRAHGLTADGIWGPASDAKGFLPAGPAKLAVDGVLGALTIEAEQRALGVAVDGKEGPQTVSAEQRRTGAGVDGTRGPDTNRHLQQYLNARIGAGLKVDGERGPATIKALQTALNEGKF